MQPILLCLRLLLYNLFNLLSLLKLFNSEEKEILIFISFVFNYFKINVTLF